MIYTYDFYNKLINISYTQSNVTIIDLLTDIREAEESEQGITYKQIAKASGGESLGDSISVGISLTLLDDWQIKFEAGEYIAKVSGGNLVGGYNGDPVAYSEGVQILLIQSAASTLVSVSSTPLDITPEDIAEAVWSYER